MRSLAAPDAVAFLLLESPSRPMHMALLQLFTRPPGSGPDFVRETYAAMRACKDIAPLFGGHPVTVRGRSLVLGWTHDDDVDLDYHFQYTSLPEPGGRDQLHQLISQLHSRNLDRRKPLWEVHVIDGLDRGRFAIFTKAHHALFDGVSFLRLLRRALSTDRESREIQVLWSQRPQAQLQFPGSAMQSQSLRNRFVRAIKSSAELGRSVTLIRAALRERDLFPAFRAPPTIFNVAGDVPWVCATQSWQIDRIDKVKDAAGASVHDVALAMCAGALRAMLSERNALPERPLVAVVPVGLRTDDDVEGRNLMSSGVCNLATDLKDPVQRLKTVQASMRYNKQLLRALPRQVSMHLGGVISAPITDGSRSGARMSSQFNVGISHVADAHLGDGREALYLNGARLDGLYGFLPVLRGHSLFIALLSNAISLNFGIVGCAGVMNDHDCLLNHLEVSLRELEGAFGL